VLRAPRVPISVETTLASGRVRIDVIDRGIGIASTDRARVFVPFFRADESRSRSSGGVGLGLVLARRIVEAHGGEIDFASAPGIETRFWFTLDVAAPSHGARTY
jgi:signal transduction histidine kinase